MTSGARGASLRLLGGLALVVIFTAGALWSQSRGSSPQPGVVLGPPPDVPLAIDKSYGTNVDLSAYDAKGREAALSAMEAAGFRWLRLRFPWNAIEPQPGGYDWQVWDTIVTDVSRHNLKIVAVLDGSPAWARTAEDGANPLAPPVEARDFGVFAGAFAARYGDQIDDYQIWDEPNIAPHWGAREIDPAAYGRLLRDGAAQIRAADPGAAILTAALAPTVEPGGANMSDVDFLNALYDWGGAEWFDVVAVQPYDLGQPLDDPAEPGQLNWNRAGLLRRVMEQHGDIGTAVWAVAFGWTNGEPKAIAAAVAQAREDWSWLGPMIWAAWSPDEPHGQYALVNEKAQPGPAYDALRSLALAPTMAWPGVYPADHPTGRYEGQWRVSPSGADIGQTGDRLIIPFHGTRLDLSVRRGDYRAFLFVTVDGQPANALPTDSEGRAYVVLYDPLGLSESLPLAHGMDDGDHVAEIVADRGWGQWAIEGWTVSREMPAHPPWAPLGLGLVATLTFATTVYTSWPWRREIPELVGRWWRWYRSLDERVTLFLPAAVAVLAWVMPGTLPSLALLGALAILLVLRPETSLPLIVLALPYYQVGKPLMGKVFSMVEILTLLGAVGWGVHRVLTWATSPKERRLSWARKPRLGLTALDWGVIALVAAGGLSLLWSAHLRESLREFRTVVLEAGIFYGLVRVMVRDRQGMWRLTDAWVLGGVSIAVVGILQWATGLNLITADGVWRVRGLYGSPNNLALYLGRILPLCVALAVWARTADPVARTDEIRRRWLYGLAAIVVAVAIVLTYSRGAWLLGVPAALLFLAAVRGRKTFLLTAGLLVAAAIVLVLIVGPGRLATLADPGQGTTFFRLQLWKSSWAMIRDHPLRGVGLDNFLYYYRSHYVLPTAWEEFNLSHPHNLVFDFWLRLGLVGVIVLVWLLSSFFRRGWRVYRRLPEGRERMLVLGLMAGMVNFVAHGLVDNAFFLVDLGFVFVLMLALAQAAGSEIPVHSN